MFASPCAHLATNLLHACSDYNLGIEASCAFGVPGGWVSAAELGFLPEAPETTSAEQRAEANKAAGGAAKGAGAGEGASLLGRDGRGQWKHQMRAGGF